MQYWQGEAALSDYRLEHQLQSFQQVCPSLTGVAVYFDYFLEVSELLTPEECDRITQLLPGAQPVEWPLSADAAAYGSVHWVLPRIGTISPWSSKALDIAHICGLMKITHIERVRRYVFSAAHLDSASYIALHGLIHDRLTESVVTDAALLSRLFDQKMPRPLGQVCADASVLQHASHTMGLSLSASDIDHLLHAYEKLKRDPTNAELMMFAQVNSEHCRHKIFNAEWTLDKHKKEQSLFNMIRYTHKKSPHNVWVAYEDNAAVMHGHIVDRLIIDPVTHEYKIVHEKTPYVLKVETHNHPTAISPFAGAATGAGGEIRDEAATGRGAQSKAALSGFCVSHLHIPRLPQPWECVMEDDPEHIASPLAIMLQGPIGAAAYNNEFGRPHILGYFRTLEMILSSQYGEVRRGYHKPIMLAGGIGHVRAAHVEKKTLRAHDLLIVLGGPGFSIGLGGGSASSKHNTGKQVDLDFASVQRPNPEMQRRAQEVINACCALGDNNPIISIHDVGAGGLSNALPELVHASGCGGIFDLRAIPNAESGMSPLEIWCNESQERYVLGISPDALALFTTLANRERCPFAVVGTVTAKTELLVKDSYFANHTVNVPLSVLFDHSRREQRSDAHAAPAHKKCDTRKIELPEAIKRVLQYPCVASKHFLITIADRTVGGMVARDQMVGPWQVPVADCAVTTDSFNAYTGQAIAIGERSPIALLHHAASARMAVGEAITNIAAAPIAGLRDIVMSANWMAAADYPGEGAGLYDAVQTIAMELCPSLQIAIPVGKDSLSMRTTWEQHHKTHAVTAPLSLVITAAASVSDVRNTLTPQLMPYPDTTLMLLDLGKGMNLLGASVLMQVYNELDDRPPDVDDPILLRHFFDAIQALRTESLILAYHDRSDGGLLTTICEMMFAARTGVTLTLDRLDRDPLAALFAEELGAVIQIKQSDMPRVQAILAEHQLAAYAHAIGELNQNDHLMIYYNSQVIYDETRTALQRYWMQTSYEMQSLRDNADCAQQEFDALLIDSDPGLSPVVSFALDPKTYRGLKPKVAILREQGVNGHIEMAAAFDRAGFASIDVHMSDLMNGSRILEEVQGLVACGGFSYGDVLGAGRGWAQSILMHPLLRDAFEIFFNRTDTFTLGVCNGCQMLSELRSIIPGASDWPRFVRNTSEQFEARLVLVEIMRSPSVLLSGMHGAILPVVVSHGEGRVVFTDHKHFAATTLEQQMALRYVDHEHRATERYPYNPNGSVEGITALTNHDGRVTMMMPHPERTFRNVQFSWHPPEWRTEDSPWMQLFYNARDFVG